MTEPIYHLAEPGDWAHSTETYQPSSFGDNGFIHFSREEQLAPVARTLYRSHNSLILLTIDTSAVPAEAVVHEDLDGSGETYPHLYGALPTAAVIATGPYLTHLEEGLWLGTRWDRDWMERMLHPDYSEVGMSGQVYSRRETIEAPAEELDIQLPLEDLRLEIIEDDVAMNRYISRATYQGLERPAHRTSIWVNTNEGWRLRFHQGTPVP